MSLFWSLEHISRISSKLQEELYLIYVVYHYSRAKRASAEVVYNVYQSCMQDSFASALSQARATIGYLVYNKKRYIFQFDFQGRRLEIARTIKLHYSAELLTSDIAGYEQYLLIKASKPKVFDFKNLGYGKIHQKTRFKIFKIEYFRF